MVVVDGCFQSMLVTVSEQCEKKLLAVKQEEKSGKAHWALCIH